MAKQGFCRTGQAAKALGLSAHQVRRLCETGLVEAELGPGGHWRITASEVARLRKEGVPLIPSAVDDSEPELAEFEARSRAVINMSPRHELLPRPSQNLIAPDEDVRTARNFPERAKIAEATDAETDWFRERKRQREEHQRAAAQTLIDQQSALQAVNTREWHHRWLEWALNAVPWGVPDEYRLAVRREVDETLQSLQPETPESVMCKLVEGAVQQGLRIWRSARDTEKALGDALRWLPWLASPLGRPTTWQVRAREEASTAISKLSDGSSFEAKLAAAMAAVQKITLEFEEETLRQKVIDESIPLQLFSSAEKEDAKAAIRAGVESSRPGSGEAELRRARQAALKPFEDKHRQRESRARLERNVDRGLDHILNFLNQLWNDDELEGFQSGFEVWSYANEIRKLVRAELLKRFENTPEATDYQIKAVIEDIMDDLLSD